MNKKQIKQDKLLKKKVLYQEYWKTIFNQSNKAKDKIKDGDTSTNIFELLSKGESNQNKDKLEQGFDKILSEQNHILKLPKDQNPIQENRILQEKTESKTLLQNKATQLSPQPKFDEQIKSTSRNVQTQNITQKITITDTKSLESGNKQIDINKDINDNVIQNEVKQVLINVSPQEQLHSNVQSQTKFGITQQQYQQQEQQQVQQLQQQQQQKQSQKQQQQDKYQQKKQQQQQQQQESLQTIIKKIKSFEKSINKCKQTNSQVKPVSKNNINQLEQTHQKGLINESHDITKDIPDIQQQLKIQNNKINIDTDKCIKKQFERTQKSEHFMNDQIKTLKPQDKSNIAQQLTTTNDSNNKSIENDNKQQQMKISNDGLIQENIKQQSEQKDQDNQQNESNTTQNQIVTRSQLKAVHKIMRTLNQKLHQDDIKIQVIWDEVLAQQSDLVPNFEKFIQCIQFLHNLEKAHFDQQKLTAQLL
ncbi:unnamed protein product [Paramecium primaurelia]|uniref:Uncharacterized protein n=1 Tax=Paramecium primaurelia TaxID=5886 RepID=A0A8S1LY76_PARPR|nr:unnamed protein product [Paramecium primaurelia]